jgi:hypothetical protein
VPVLACIDVSNGLSDASVSLSQIDPKAADEVKRLRAIGIVKVKQADEILTKRGIRVSWSDGLDGFSHRQDIAAFHGSALTVRTAISLLLAEQSDLPQETVLSVCSWIQKYKARSLARTIGVRSYGTPPIW